MSILSEESRSSIQLVYLVDKLVVERFCFDSRFIAYGGIGAEMVARLRRDWRLRFLYGYAAGWR